MRFYCHRETDSFEKFKNKVEIVEQLLTPPVSIPLIESTYIDDGLGKKAAREIVQKTTHTLLLCILLSFVLFVGINLAGFSESLLRDIFFLPPFIYFLFLISFKLIIVTRWFIDKIIIRTEVESHLLEHFSSKAGTKEDLTKIENIFTAGNLDGSEKNIRRLSLYLCSGKQRIFLIDSILLNVPFSLRNIWLWSFIIAVFTILINKKYSINLTGVIDNEKFSEFIADFFRALLIGVVSYIATNIISELLQLREQYVQGRDDMKSLNKIIESSNTSIKAINEDARQITENLVFLGETENVRKALISLRKNLSSNLNPHPVDKTFTEFTTTIEKQFKVFDSKVTHNDIIDLWMINSLNQYFKILSEEFQKTSSITTRYNFFGKILNATFRPILQNAEFLKRFNQDYEIFTVFVLPPKRFLNYIDGVESDPDWDDFIDVTIEAAKKGLQINRHFLSLDFNQVNENLIKEEFGDESIDLKKSEFVRQLTEKYWFSNDMDIDNRLLIKKDNNSYLKVKSGDIQEGYINKSLNEILEEIHSENACKVIELKIPHFESENKSPLDDLNDVLWDSKTEKSIDYFAIRNRNYREWLFCYRTVYDKTFDFAEIEILHNKQQDLGNWNNLCANLNKVFLTEELPDEQGITRNQRLGVSIYPIRSYK